MESKIIICLTLCIVTLIAIVFILSLLDKWSKEILSFARITRKTIGTHKNFILKLNNSISDLQHKQQNIIEEIHNIKLHIDIDEAIKNLPDEESLRQLSEDIYNKTEQLKDINDELQKHE